MTQSADNRIRTTLSVDAIDQREEFLLSLLAGASELALAGYDKQKADGAAPANRMKGPQDYLTETDGAVEAHIRARIAAAFPEDSFLGEETGGNAGDVVWVVDPIDGTANFARGIPHFCIAIALVANGETQLGGTINPVLAETYLARLGRGASRNGVPIRVAPTSEISATSFELGWSTRSVLADYIAAHTALVVAGSNVRRASSGALALCYVADGRSDGYAELLMNPWDCLGGLLMVREAGGVTCGFLSGGGLDDGGAVLAATPAVAAILSQATGIALFEGRDRRP
ncbi:inositol monophosphatase family protein [Paracoccus cavernae]|uniref:Inositol monophosphatase family protein n=2 Tax=Paracoccus cavernae TaxID=1571207 RepID=A0ABT8D301_9RHOB|nr:inositol monophosphatase family protein [Paracoccus cavernae]